MFAAFVVPVMLVEPPVDGICVPASCADELAGTSLTFHALSAIEDEKLNVAMFFPDCSEMTFTSGPVIVIVGIAVDSVIDAEDAELSLYTESRTLTYTVFVPSPEVSVTLFELANVSQDAADSVATPLIPQIFIAAASEQVMLSVTVVDVVTLVRQFKIQCEIIVGNLQTLT